VRHVADGDTLVLADGRKVRLIGVDTPELSDPARNRDNARRNDLDEEVVEAFAEKAKAFTKSLVEGHRVRLEQDWQRVDKYGRTLAYLYREEDDLFVNAQILREGYGFPTLYFPHRHQQAFRALRDEAREAGRGLWRRS
jgi:micrococcal nuclease